MVATKEIPSVMDILTKTIIFSNPLSLSKQKKSFDDMSLSNTYENDIYLRNIRLLDDSFVQETSEL